jgi:hypothetical protein
MTSLEAAEEKEADRRRQQKLAAVAAEADRAQDEHQEREEERTAMIAEHWDQSQSQLSSLDLSSSSSSADNTKALDHDIFGEDGEPRHSGRVRRPTRDIASQMSQDAKPAEAKERKWQAKTKRKGKAKAMSTSQLIGEFNLESQ